MFVLMHQHFVLYMFLYLCQVQAVDGFFVLWEACRAWLYRVSGADRSNLHQAYIFLVCCAFYSNRCLGQAKVLQ
jgi:hypothetical protein